eukprot:50440_1
MSSQTDGSFTFSTSTSSCNWDTYLFGTDDSDLEEYTGSSDEIVTQILQKIPCYYKRRKDKTDDKNEWISECNKQKKYSIGKTIELILSFWIRTIVNVNRFDVNVK